MYKSEQFPRQQDKVKVHVTSKERIDFIFDNFESKMNRLYEYIMNPDKREILNKQYYENKND
jgi:hypothetical protein